MTVLVPVVVWVWVGLEDILTLMSVVVKDSVKLTMLVIVVGTNTWTDVMVNIVVVTTRVSKTVSFCVLVTVTVSLRRCRTVLVSVGIGGAALHAFPSLEPAAATCATSKVPGTRIKIDESFILED